MQPPEDEWAEKLTQARNQQQELRWLRGAIQELRNVRSGKMAQHRSSYPEVRNMRIRDMDWYVREWQEKAANIAAREGEVPQGDS